MRFFPFGSRLPIDMAFFLINGKAVLFVGNEIAQEDDGGGADGVLRRPQKIRPVAKL